MSAQTPKKKRKINDLHNGGCSMPSDKRTRMVYEIQSTDSNQSSQTAQEIGDNIIADYNDQNMSNLRYMIARIDKKAAERSRLYRERHREEINQRRRETRQHKRNLQKILDMDKIKKMAQEKSNKKKKSHTMRQQRYYERNRDKINKRKRDNRLKQNMSKSAVGTSTEIKRNYREKNQNENNDLKKDSKQHQENVEGIHTRLNRKDLNATEQIMEVVLSGQQSLNSTNDYSTQELVQNFTSSILPHQLFTQHFEETQNDRVHTITADVECTGDQNSNSYNSDCSKRWCYVRDYYIRRKGNPVKFSSGEAAKKRSDLLSFLDSSTQKSCVNNIFKEERVESGNEIQHNYDDMVASTCEDGRNCGDDCYSYDNDIDNEKFDNCDIKVQNILQNETNISVLKEIYQKRSTQNELDETDLFFISMSKIVKKLPRFEQAQLRMQIGLLIGNAELRYIGNETS